MGCRGWEHRHCAKPLLGFLRAKPLNRGQSAQLKKEIIIMVNFVGASCGAVDLITVRGKSLIEQADVIIYAGSLVNPELLDYARNDC